MIRYKESAYYEFGITGDLSVQSCRLDSRYKEGSYQIFDELFDKIKTAQIKKYCSEVAMGTEDILYALQFYRVKDEPITMLFDTTVTAYPCGIVSLCLDEPQSDCILFRIRGAEVFEIYVYKGCVNQTYELLTILNDSHDYSGLTNNQSVKQAA